MEESKKRLLMVFLFLYITIEIFLLLIAIVYFYVEGPQVRDEQFELRRQLSFLLPSIFGILSPILFLLIWKRKYQKK